MRIDILQLFLVYFASLHLSLAAMEAFCWIILTASLVITLKKKTFIWPSKWMLYSCAGLLFTAIISFFLNIKKPGEFIEYIGSFRWIIAYILWLQFFNLYFKKLNFFKILLVGQGVLIIAGLYSFYQFFTAHDPFRPHVVFHHLYDTSPFWRPNSFFGLPTTYSYASAMFLSISLAFLFYYPIPRRSWHAWIRGLYLLISPLNIFIAFTRTTWFAAIASSMLILRKKDKKIFYRTLFVLTVFLSTCYFGFSQFRDRVHSITDPTYVANSNRIYLWQANWMIFKEYPVFGIGFKENRKQIDRYVDRLKVSNVMRNHPHNTYINFLASLGICGFICFMLFIGYNVYANFKSLQNTHSGYEQALLLGVLGLQLVLLVGGLTECTFEDKELMHQYILFTALCEYLRLQRMHAPGIIDQIKEV